MRAVLTHIPCAPCRYVFRSLVTLSGLITPQQARCALALCANTPPYRACIPCAVTFTRDALRIPQQFLDGIAVVNFVPTPLVMFVTWCVRLTCYTHEPRLWRRRAHASAHTRDGFMADGIVGAILMTIGMCVSATHNAQTCTSFIWHARARALALLCLTRTPHSAATPTQGSSPAFRWCSLAMSCSCTSR